MRDVANVITTPRVSDDMRRALKALYNASLRGFTGYWAVVESSVGLFIGRVESVNPDHGDVILNSASRVDVSLSFDKLWVRGSQVKSLYVVGGKDKSRAESLARKILVKYLSREEL